MFWIRALVDGEGVIAGLGEGVDLRPPAVAAVSPAGDGLALVGRGWFEVSEGGSLRHLLGAGEVGKYNKRIEVPMVRVSSFETDGLRATFYRTRGWQSGGGRWEV